MTKQQINIIKAIQNGLPICEEPYLKIAQQVGISQDELLAQLQAWKDDGTIRRFGAILRHHKAGYSANAMGIWDVPDERAEDFGLTAAEHKSISHCYQRPRFKGFKYNLYTMIHGRSKQECESVAKEISERTGINDYSLLYTTAEYKKSSPIYFTDREENK